MSRNDESNEEIAVAKISSTLRQKSHAVLVQFCAKSLVRKGLSTNSQVTTGTCISLNFSQKFQIFFEVSKNLPEMETPLYRSEGIKFNSGRIVWRSFTLPSEEIAR